MNFLQQLVNGLAQGSIYALIALGFSLVFSVLRFINFAHGDLMMTGAYFGFFIACLINVDLWVCMLITGCFCGIVGCIVQKIIYQPFIVSPKRKSSQNLLIAAIGISFVLQYSCMLIFTSAPRGYPANFSGEIVNVFGIFTDSHKIVIFITSIIVCIWLKYFFSRTKTGLAIRGFSSDNFGGFVCGISGKNVCAVCFVIGTIIAGFSGVLYGCTFSLSPFMGMEPGIKAFAAAVIGGIGSIPGAFFGGLFLGLAETFCGAFLNSAYKNSVAFIILIVCLVAFPSGFFSKDTQAYVDRN